MDTFAILVAIYMAVIPPALGALFWSRLNRIETTLSHIASTYVTREEFHPIASNFVTREEFLATMSEMRGDMNQGFASVRSDLTQVALAVGARPRASGD